MLIRAAEYFIKMIRPNFKGLSKDINGSDFFFECSYYVLCLIRGLVLNVFGLRNRLALVGPYNQFFYRRNVFFGKKVKVGSHCIISGLGKHGLIIGDYSSIASYCRIVVSTSHTELGEFIRIGNNVGIGEFASLGGSGGLTIGDNTIIAQYFSAHPENHVFRDSSLSIKNQGTERKEISIGEGCWIGAKVTVLAGVKVGNGVVIGAGSVVTKDVEENAVVVGNPARVIRIRGKND